MKTMVKIWETLEYREDMAEELAVRPGMPSVRPGTHQ